MLIATLSSVFSNDDAANCGELTCQVLDPDTSDDMNTDGQYEVGPIQVKALVSNSDAGYSATMIL